MAKKKTKTHVRGEIILRNGEFRGVANWDETAGEYIGIFDTHNGAIEFRAATFVELRTEFDNAVKKHKEKHERQTRR